jgi:hypothetical protein
MTLGGKRMKPLGRMQWTGILLAGGSLVLTGYMVVLSIALMDAQSPTAPLMPLKWLLLAGIVGLLGSGLWVQCTWKAQQGRIRHE